MKTFLFALAFVCVALVATGLVFEYVISYSATQAYSLESARPGDGGVGDRAGWSEDL